MQKAWIKGTWGPKFTGDSVELLRVLVPWLAIMVTFGNLLKNSHVIFTSDSQQVTSTLNSQNHRDPLVIKVVRQWVLALLTQYLLQVHFTCYFTLPKH